jgi:hypothetical protein
MPVIEYDYAVVAGRRSPLIPLGLGHQGKWQRVEAYVDSGAFYSVFKPDFAQPLGCWFGTSSRALTTACRVVSPTPTGCDGDNLEKS